MLRDFRRCLINEKTEQRRRLGNKMERPDNHFYENLVD